MRTGLEKGLVRPTVLVEFVKAVGVLWSSVLTGVLMGIWTPQDPGYLSDAGPSTFGLTRGPEVYIIR